MQIHEPKMKMTRRDAQNKKSWKTFLIKARHKKNQWRHKIENVIDRQTNISPFTDSLLSEPVKFFPQVFILQLTLIIIIVAAVQGWVAVSMTSRQVSHRWGPLTFLLLSVLSPGSPPLPHQIRRQRGAVGLPVLLLSVSLGHREAAHFPVSASGAWWRSLRWRGLEHRSHLMAEDASHACPDRNDDSDQLSGRDKNKTKKNTDYYLKSSLAWMRWVWRWCLHLLSKSLTAGTSFW